MNTGLYGRLLTRLRSERRKVFKFKFSLQVERSTKHCANETEILDKIKTGYNRDKIPGGKVREFVFKLKKFL